MLTNEDAPPVGLEEQRGTEFVQRVLREHRSIRTILFGCTRLVPIIAAAIQELLSNGYVVVLSMPLCAQVAARDMDPRPFLVTPDRASGLDDLGAIAALTGGGVSDIMLFHDSHGSISAAVHQGARAEYVDWSAHVTIPTISSEIAAAAFLPPELAQLVADYSTSEYYQDKCPCGGESLDEQGRNLIREYDVPLDEVPLDGFTICAYARSVLDRLRASPSSYQIRKVQGPYSYGFRRRKGVVQVSCGTWLYRTLALVINSGKSDTSYHVVVPDYHTPDLRR